MNAVTMPATIDWYCLLPIREILRYGYVSWLGLAEELKMVHDMDIFTKKSLCG